MSIPDRFYYFNELRQVGFKGGGLEIGGGPCFSMPVSPEQEQEQEKQATQELNIENMERNELQEIENGTIKMLDEYYIDKTVPVKDFIKGFSKEVKKTDKMPWPSYVKDIIKEYKKIEDETVREDLLNKAQKAFDKGWEAWIKREREIEKKHYKKANKLGISLAEYRFNLNLKESDSPRAVAELKVQIAEAKKAEEEARKARKLAAIQAAVNRRMGRSGRSGRR